MELLITAPLASLELIIGEIFPYIFIGTIQVSIILALGYYFFNLPINGGLWRLAFATLLFICASLVLILVISPLTTNQLQSMQMTLIPIPLSYCSLVLVKIAQGCVALTPNSQLLLNRAPYLELFFLR
ncbi:ABC transporter permease, partial [Colwellia sp. C1TZA3]|uniref:ABC transporter permease n=1 Tax=Colwellia sp. C1TZA3 TaxID=2508879 RepID=UPI00295004CD